MKKFILANSIPRWVILLIDQVITSWSFVLAFFVITQFEFSNILRGHFFIYTGLYCITSLSVFFLMRIHTGVIRYSNTQDIVRIFSAVLATSFIYILVLSMIIIPVYHINTVNIFIVLLINFFISSSLLIMLRIGAKSFFQFIKRSTSAEKETVLIFGSDTNSMLIKKALENSISSRFVIAGFIDDNYQNVNKYIQQKKVYSAKNIEQLRLKLKVDKIVVMSEDLKTEGRKNIVEKCLEIGLKVLTVPPTEQWISGRLRLNQIQDLKIEDLLQRDPIVIQSGNISREITGRRVLVTGGAGSIGSEIVRQVLTFDPAMIIICDQAESPLHELQLEVEEAFPDANIKIYIANISNYNRMYSLFEEFSPQIVFHAAAYKHVPMMENNPSEAIITNILGTKTLADLSIAFDVEKFVMISTDKAVNPTNIMGASKRIAEIYIQSLNNVNVQSLNNINVISSRLNDLTHSKTRFVTTRFGNVLGSNGSVIPRFRAQIEKGAPLTVTHPEITRYFMTIPEAVQLVLEAGSMGKGGEIFLFDMGEPVKIADLARKMIKLAGLIPDVDIKIVYTGLRPGEKLYEELLNKEEESIPTHHDKIKISKVRTYIYDKVASDIKELLTLVQKENDDYEIVKKMKDIVPEFLSKNSKYEELDYGTANNNSLLIQQAS
ncbi:polysaccharide biosynthesis protein [Adhaeribacter radiodurans]|uniref:Polysaccharide biosynthesis protein n=1 Tax=Adhaeribacter radiodurans TaxID=2745197 RepID=A0A7L7L4M9_9BACT|nr:nucleoside-diphosphate sugar epimerase/dehydratase [Adhaeribacter radiodurans]QMU27339.1 polysaccharide biosynthesis protein [Adhaeribacter radiodurans]